MDIRNTKIYFGEDTVLGEQIFKKLKELEADPRNYWKYWNDNLSKTNPKCFFIENSLDLSWTNDFEFFNEQKEYKLIFLKDLETGTKKQIGWRFNNENWRKAAKGIIGNDFSIRENGVEFDTNSALYHKMVELKVLEQWCNAVYEEAPEFKVGDIVYIVKSCGSSNNKTGEVGKVTKVDEKSCLIEDRITGWEAKKDLRFATKEEIEQYNNKFNVGDWVVITDSGGGTNPKDIEMICKIVSTNATKGLLPEYTIEIDRDKIGNQDRFLDPCYIRKATLEEIERENNFKEGDWVYVQSSHFGWVKQGDVVQLGGVYWENFGVRKENGEQYFSAITVEYPNGNSGRGNIAFRKATSVEIQKANEIKIGDYTVNIVSSSQVIIDDYTYSYKDVENVLAVLNLKKVGYIAVGCSSQYKLTKSTVERILKAMQNAKF